MTVDVVPKVKSRLRLWHEMGAAYAFVERNVFLMRRYWAWEAAFTVYMLASSLSVMYIGKAQEVNQDYLVLYLGIGTLVWSYLRTVFSIISEMIAWERWEGTIEYTMMAPVSRLTHLLGVSLFSVFYGLLRSALLLGAIALLFDLELDGANLAGAMLVLAVGSLSFIGVGMMAAVLPLLFTERGDEMTFTISSVLLLVSGVYYPVTVLPNWMQPVARVSPATYVLEGMRAAILDGAPVTALWPSLWPTLVIGLVTIPAGVLVFSFVERYAKRTGRLKRSG